MYPPTPVFSLISAQTSEIDISWLKRNFFVWSFAAMMTFSSRAMLGSCGAGPACGFKLRPDSNPMRAAAFFERAPAPT